MTECRFCLAITTDGEPTSEYKITGPGKRSYRWLCQQCADQLRHLGLNVEEA